MVSYSNPKSALNILAVVSIKYFTLEIIAEWSERISQLKISEIHLSNSKTENNLKKSLGNLSLKNLDRKTRKRISGRNLRSLTLKKFFIKFGRELRKAMTKVLRDIRKNSRNW